MTSRNQGLSSNDQGRQRRETLGTRLKSLHEGIGRRHLPHERFTRNVLRNKVQGLVPKSQTGLTSRRHQGCDGTCLGDFLQGLALSFVPTFISKKLMKTELINSGCSFS